VKVGIGLPNTLLDAPGSLLTAWARRAEERGFSTLATIDRVAYPSFESLIALAAAAAVTERIGLLTDILLAPTRNPVLLAKEAASVDQISGGRLTLGLAVGRREDDYTASGQPFGTRGKRFEAALDLLHRAWRGEPVGGSQNPVSPRPVRGEVPILIGGMSDAVVNRVITWGIGWTVGGASPDAAAAVAERVRTVWRDSGRDGEPYLVALSYYGMGGGSAGGADANLMAYYGPWAERMVRFLPRTAEAAGERIAGFAELGFDELVFFPTIPDLSQVDLLADAVL